MGCVDIDREPVVEPGCDDHKGMSLESQLPLSRRRFLSGTGGGIGLMALASLLSPRKLLSEPKRSHMGLPGIPHFVPRAKRVIYLFQSGAPSQIDLFDHKPQLNGRTGEDLPDSIRKGQRLTGRS